MTYPSTLDKITITGSYVNLDGRVADGTVTFAPDSNTWLTAPALKTVIVPEVITAKLINGSFSVELPAITDDPDITPTGGTYKVSEAISGKSRTYSIQVNVGESPIDLSQKAPAQPVTSTYTMVRSINGKVPNAQTGNLVLTAADLGVLPAEGGTITGDLVVTGRLAAAGFALPLVGPTSRLPAYRQATWAQLFQSGHGWTASGSGVGSSNANDPTTFSKGTQSFAATTAGTGAVANIRKLADAAKDLTGKMIRLTFRVVDVTHLSQINFILGTASVANSFTWRVHTHATTAQNLVQSGEWVTVHLSWADVRSASGAFSINANGTPSTKTGFTDMMFQVVDDNTANPVTVNLQAVEIVPDTTTTFPNGVVSITFDDSYASQFAAARPKMDALGFRGTCYTIADNIGLAGYMTKPQLRLMQDSSGWEIAGHSYTSTNHNAKYTTLPTRTVEAELRNMRAWLVDNGFTSDHFAYPGGWFGPTTDGDPIDQLARKYFATARSISSADTLANFPPAMPMRICAVSGIGGMAGVASPANTTKLLSAGGPLDRTRFSGNWLVLTFHDVVAGDATTTNQCSQADFNSIMDAIAARGIQVRPVSDVIRYYS